MVYRNDFKHAHRCPRCKSPRYDEDSRPIRQLLYLSIQQWLRSMLAHPDHSRQAHILAVPSFGSLSGNTHTSSQLRPYCYIKVKAGELTLCHDACRALRWPDEKPAVDNAQEDICDSELWEWFKADEMLHDSCGQPFPVEPLALGICGDGVEVNRGHHRKPHTVFCVAVTVLNLPPWVRSKPGGCHLVTVLPGPQEPKDAQPYWDILTDELVHLEELGMVTRNAAKYALTGRRTCILTGRP